MYFFELQVDQVFFDLFVLILTIFRIFFAISFFFVFFFNPLFQPPSWSWFHHYDVFSFLPSSVSSSNDLRIQLFIDDSDLFRFHQFLLLFSRFHLLRLILPTARGLGFSQEAIESGNVIGFCFFLSRFFIHVNFENIFSRISGYQKISL